MDLAIKKNHKSQVTPVMSCMEYLFYFTFKPPDILISADAPFDVTFLVIYISLKPNILKKLFTENIK